jgi:hypothetical protein
VTAGRRGVRGSPAGMGGPDGGGDVTAADGVRKAVRQAGSEPERDSDMTAADGVRVTLGQAWASRMGAVM